MSNNELLDRALRAREEFLADKPHMQAYQDEIDALMDKVPQHQRLEVIHQLALEKMMDLGDALRQLKGILDAESRKQ
jgi:uncharacterized FlaG/YvyC family protein